MLLLAQICKKKKKKSEGNNINGQIRLAWGHLCATLHTYICIVQSKYV